MSSQRPRRPRIVMLSGHSPPAPDGVGDYTSRLVAELAQLRPEWNWVWVHRRPRWYSPPVKWSQGTTHYQWNRGWTPRDRTALCSFLRWLSPSLLHVQEQIHSFHETGAELELALNSGDRGPLVTTLHEFHTELPNAHVTADLIRNSDLVIANDTRTADRSLSEAKRSVDHIWWSGPNVKPPDPAWNCKTNPNIVTTFGLLSAIKRLDVVRQALELVRETNPNLVWRIIGPFTPETNPIHRELAEKLSAPWVEFTGGFTDLADRRLRTMLAESRMMLLPFQDGASPRRGTLQAGWAFGLPIVTTPPERSEPNLRHGENLLEAESGDPESWSNAIRSILQDAGLEARLREGSLRTADEYSWAKLARLQLAAYEKLLDQTFSP